MRFKEKLCRYPVATAIIVMVVLAAFLLAPMLFFQGEIAETIPNFILAGIVPRAAASALWIFVLCMLGVPHLGGFRKKGLGKGLLLGLPLLTIGIAALVISLAGVYLADLKFQGIAILIVFTLTNFFVGLVEETAFRGVILNVMLEKWGNDKKGQTKALVISSVFFGMMHLVNLTIEPIFSVLSQVVYAAAMGLLLGVIYLKTRNMWAVIIIHMMTDWFAEFLGCFTYQGAVRLEETINPAEAIITIFGAVIMPLVLAQIYARKVKSVDETEDKLLERLPIHTVN